MPSFPQFPDTLLYPGYWHVSTAIQNTANPLPSIPLSLSSLPSLPLYLLPLSTYEGNTEEENNGYVVFK